MTSSDPRLCDELLERVLSRIGLASRPPLDLAGLNTLYAAWSGKIPFDNVQKRIWFASDRSTPVTGGDPTLFFENWLRYGTGGTCWPTSGGMAALLCSLGFHVRRIAGSMTESDGRAQRAGHGTVLVTLDGVDYLVDASMSDFEVLPLVRNTQTSAGKGIHALVAVPFDNAFEVRWHPGWLRDRPAFFRTNPEFDPVDHAFFLEGYDLSKQDGPFNDTLHVCRRSSDSIVTVRGHRKIAIAADGSGTTVDLTDDERRTLLIEELGFSEQIVEKLPPDTISQEVET